MTNLPLNQWSQLNTEEKFFFSINQACISVQESKLVHEIQTETEKEKLQKFINETKTTELI